MKYLYRILFPFLLLPLVSQAQNHGDTLRQETRLDQVYQQYSLSGQGVIVAMIERGIDYTHPDFIDANGKTRIAYIYDMIDQTGANAPGNTYGIGTIYTRTQIDQALTNNTPLGSTDRHGHGTACTGIACGDGSGVTGAPFQGVAPGATIIAVKVMLDYFPPTGNIAGQQGIYNPAYIPVALEFVKDKSTELGLPSVSLLNMGSTGGPTDGTSKITRAMRDFAGPGRLLVCGAGDDGGGNNRAEGTVSQGNTTELEIKKTTAGNLRMEVWYDGNDRFDVSIVRPNNSVEGPFSSPTTNQLGDNQFLTGINYYHRGSDVDFDEATNGKRQIMIDFTTGTGTFKVQLQGTSVSNGNFSASLNPATHHSDNDFLNQLFSQGSICDFASAENIIVPTSYVLKNKWLDKNGALRRRVNEGDPGEIWVGSSEGPTRDGRIGVDVASPGEINVGAYSPNTYYASFDHLLLQNGNDLYGIQSAVSGAAPVVVGTLALMLEVNSNLSPQEAKQILRQTARSDNFTGTVPNNTWGHGKLDAFGAVQATYATVSNDRLQSLDIAVWPNPVKDWLYFSSKKLQGKAGLAQVFSTSGKKVADLQLDGMEDKLNLSELKAGVYFMQIQAGTKQAWTKLVKVD